MDAPYYTACPAGLGACTEPIPRQSQGLSLAAITKLTEQWKTEQRAFAERDLSGVDSVYRRAHDADRRVTAGIQRDDGGSDDNHEREVEDNNVRFVLPGTEKAGGVYLDQITVPG